MQADVTTDAASLKAMRKTLFEPLKETGLSGSRQEALVTSALNAVRAAPDQEKMFEKIQAGLGRFAGKERGR